MGMSVKEMITMTEGLTRKEVGFQNEQGLVFVNHWLNATSRKEFLVQVEEIDSGITVEEMIAIENDVSVEEMIAMKNDISVQEVANAYLLTKRMQTTLSLVFTYCWDPRL